MKAFFLALFTFFFLTHSSFGDDYLNAWYAFAQGKDSERLLSWMRGEAECILAREPEKRVRCPVELPPFYGRLGLFVTFMLDGKNRGCFGSFYHASPNAEDVMRGYILGALRSDYRSVPLSQSELDGADIVLTIAAQPFPALSLESVDISSYGVMVNSEVVFVPAEIKTHERLRRLCKGTIESVHAFKAITIK
ncbi:MAG: AMMECR1 domain-containing protein [Leptospirales bacterium]|nr:AMMECR1 domain-containing protein [Leptospirales bacterium]